MASAENQKQPVPESLPTVILVIGMAGSGKTTFMQVTTINTSDVFSRDETQKDVEAYDYQCLRNRL